MLCQGLLFKRKTVWIVDFTPFCALQGLVLGVRTSWFYTGSGGFAAVHNPPEYVVPFSFFDLFKWKGRIEQGWGSSRESQLPDVQAQGRFCTKAWYQGVVFWSVKEAWLYPVVFQRRASASSLARRD